MKSKTLFSDDMLNAFIDNELQHVDFVKISTQLVNDSDLRAQVEELRVVRNLVKMSYKEIEHPSISLRLGILDKIPAGLAASLLLALGLVLGWTVNHYASSPSLFDMAQSIENRTSTTKGKSNIMLHVSSDNRYRWKVVLDEVEQTLISAKKLRTDVQVHLVTNGKAINVAKLNHNPFAKRIQYMIKKYPNFTMQVCEQTLERLYYSKNKKIRLLPGAKIVRSALGEILKKRQQGWLYMKI